MCNFAAITPKPHKSMKKSFLSLLTLCALTATAQNNIVVGDMDNSGALTVSDVTALTDAVLHPEKVRTLSTKCDPNASEPSAIAGAWRAMSGTTLTLTAEGAASEYSADATAASRVAAFEYYPYSRDLLLLDADGYLVKDYHVLRYSQDYLVLRLADGTYATYYPSDRYVTGLSLSATSLALKTGETQQLSVTVTPDGGICGGLTWTSSNPEVASVDQTGLVTALKGGTSTISVTTESGETLSAQCSVDVTQLVTSITLSATTLTLGIDDYTKLTATVLPSDASDLSISWSSSNDAVAEVNTKGVVTVNGYGHCTITATANDGSGVKAECVIEVPLMHNGHAYVDLGLPSGTLWATTNVGASEPEDYGYYFAWGEVEPKSTYDWSTYFDSNCEKYNINGGKTELDLEDDAAYMNWGEGWRMPSDAQLEELRTNCTWTWDSTKKGYSVVGPNKTSLFLPAAGFYYDSSLDDAGSYGYYWSRSLSTSSSRSAYYLGFSSGGVGWYGNGRYYGFSVRPVRQN